MGLELEAEKGREQQRGGDVSCAPDGRRRRRKEAGVAPGWAGEGGRALVPRMTGPRKAKGGGASYPQNCPAFRPGMPSRSPS